MDSLVFLERSVSCSSNCYRVRSIFKIRHLGPSNYQIQATLVITLIPMVILPRFLINKNIIISKILIKRFIFFKKKNMKPVSNFHRKYNLCICALCRVVWILLVPVASLLLFIVAIIIYLAYWYNTRSNLQTVNI